MRSTTKPTLVAPFLAAALLLVVGGCAGEGVTYEQIEQPLARSCVSCHDAKGFSELHEAVVALDDALFTEEAFPNTAFPAGLTTRTTAELISAAEVAGDGDIAPGTAQRKAWMLHELNELGSLLEEATPPDYTTQSKFDAFATFGDAGAYEGCEIADKLDLGHQGDPEGMPPRWAPKLLELLEMEFGELSAGDRQLIKDYVDGLLPGGVRACKPGEDSAS